VAVRPPPSLLMRRASPVCVCVCVCGGGTHIGVNFIVAHGEGAQPVQQQATEPRALVAVLLFRRTAGNGGVGHIAPITKKQRERDR